ncbi:MAG: hypothetical protein QOJ39_2860 [Candidatus Eremiobacteraeota bacterium]|jgi:hypothetical protein|nr:hypothetical protein [Candidatus Eremiobacteraeota bacterium]MEA2720996.1 hypothetical protein [Candidatus Eremiobacteraeota bacterium]
MTPPFLARAIVAAAAPPLDYESVAGDLEEEYAGRVESAGRAHADRWYWSQALRSVPALLAYTRVRPSLVLDALTAALVVVLLVAMLFVAEFMCNALFSVYPHASGARSWPFFVAGWADAAFFGALLTVIVRSRGLRLTVIASLALVAAIAVPIFLGYSSPLSAGTWLLLLGAVPAMSAGTALVQVLRRR